MYPDKTNMKKPRRAVADIVEKHAGLKELSEEYPWLRAFLEEAVGTDLHLRKETGTKLDCMSEKEARRIGKSLAPSLRARKTANAGVFQWKNQNRSVKQLFKQHGWFEETILTIAKEVRMREQRAQESAEKLTHARRCSRTRRGVSGGGSSPGAA